MYPNPASDLLVVTLQQPDGPQGLPELAAASNVHPEAEATLNDLPHLLIPETPSWYNQDVTDRVAGSTERAGLERVQIFDALGRLCYQNNNAGEILEIPLSGFHSGEFTLQTISNGQTKSQRFVIRRD